MHETIVMAAILAVGIFIGGSIGNVRMETPELDSANSLCSLNGGIDYLVIKTLQQNSVFCKNGAKFILENSK